MQVNDDAYDGPVDAVVAIDLASGEIMRQRVLLPSLGTAGCAAYDEQSGFVYYV